jgi:hypothetical protein
MEHRRRELEESETLVRVATIEISCVEIGGNCRTISTTTPSRHSASEWAKFSRRANTALPFWMVLAMLSAWSAMAVRLICPQDSANA